MLHATYEVRFRHLDKYSDIYPMSRTPSTDLFTLIKALTKTEKRYVKQELGRHRIGEVNQSEVLFDAVDSLTLYNEESIKERYARYGFTHRLPEAKRELVVVILRAMRQFHANRSVYRRAMAAILDAEFLRLRGLFALAEQRLAAATSDVQLLQHDALEVLLLSAQREVLRMQDKLTLSGQTNERMSLTAAAQRLTESSRVEDLADRMDHLVAVSGRSPTPEVKALANNLKQAGDALHPISSPASQNHWLRMLSKKALFIDNDPSLALTYDLSRLGVIEQSEQQKRVNAHQWVNLTSSVALRLILLGRITEARIHCSRLEAYWEQRNEQLTPHNQQSLAATIVNLQIQLALQSNDFEEFYSGLPVTDAILDSINTPSLVETVVVCQFNIALILFGLHKYRACNKRLFVLDDYDSSLRAEVHEARRLLAIVCHLEQQNESVVISLIRAERRIRKSSTIPTDVEVLLTLVKKIVDMPPGLKLNNAYRAAQVKLQNINQEGSEPVTNLFDFQAWVDARLNKKSWRAVVNSRSS